MPGSLTTPSRTCTRVNALARVAFRRNQDVSARNDDSFAAQWLACTLPYRRFADTLANACARLGADVVRYTFIVMDLHHLLLAGLPAHGFPISRPSPRLASVLNQGPFPPSALPDFNGTTGLSATPPRPACPSRASGWSCA